MPDVFSAFNLPPVIPTEPGSLVRPKYRDKVYDSGSVGIEQIGEDDLDGLIQSSKEECLIYNILERSVSNPDILNQFKGNFVDVTSDQISYAEHLQRSIDMKNSFDKLPVQLRKMFDNNIHEFINSLNDGSADAKIKDFIRLNQDKFVKPSESEVSSNESV